MPAPTSAADRSAAARLAATASIELAPGALADIDTLRALLPRGTPVFVPHLPRHALDGSLPMLAALRQAGFEPVPHVAARRLRDAAEYRSFLGAACARGVREVLLLGGDVDRPAGPFAEAADLLEGDALAAAGMRCVHFGAYPDGHPVVPAPRVAAALERKFALAARQGIEAGIVTQFSFEPASVAALARAQGPGRRIRLGMAGPSTPSTLLRFARICGVGDALRGAARLGQDALRLARNADPTAALVALAAALGPGLPARIDGLHVYAFGGAARSAAWISAMARGVDLP
jgi:methylenetetrahydrofolate reductase (NADPH)